MPSSVPALFLKALGSGRGGWPRGEIREEGEVGGSPRQTSFISASGLRRGRAGAIAG